MPLAAISFLLAASAFDEKIESFLAETPVLRRAHWGALAVDAKDGRVRYARNADQLFTPASNTKLFSTALALTRLGADHRFVTRVVADSNGDLRLIGGGDPTLSARPIPYARDRNGGDPLGPLDAIASQVAAAGISRVRGNIVGDDTAYAWEPFPEGWTQDDTLWEYGAPVSALILHDNYFAMRVSPGSPPTVTVTPPLPYFQFDVRARSHCCGPNKLSLSRAPGSRLVEIGGSLARAETLEIAVDDPALYAAFALREALIRRGIAVDGDAVARHRSGDAPAPVESGREVARRVSPPLIETLKTINKVSQNLQAEIALREVARQTGAAPTLAAGIAEMKTFLGGIGVPEDAFHFEDGSGLSRKTLISPSAVVTLLRHMDRPAWRDLLPQGGVDGTLYSRYRDWKDGEVWAKTGTIGHVGALSGYARRKGGEWIAFSVIVNHANARSGEIRGFIDKIVVALLE